MGMKDVVIPNVSLPDLPTQILAATLKKHLDELEEMYRANRQQLMDFYLAQQTDNEKYLRKYFDINTDPSKGAEYPHNLILSQVNLTAKIIDKKARAYRRQPVRLIDGKRSDEYDRLLLEGGIKSTAKLIDRFTWLLGDVCTMIIADESTERLRFDVPPYYRPFFDGDNTVDPVAVMYPIGKVLGNKNELVSGWLYWDESHEILFEEGTWNVLSDKENVHRTFNAIFTHRIKPFKSHWTKDAQDVVDMNRDVNVALTSLNNAIRYHGFPILAGIGVDPKDAKNVKIRFDQMIAVAADPAGRTVNLQLLVPSVNWEGMINTIKARIEMVTATWNVNIKWEISGTIGSGIALKILDVDNSDDIEDVRELYEEFLEEPMLRRVQAIGKAVSWVKEIPGRSIALDWPSEQTVETEDERAKRMETDIKNNLSNPITEMIRQNPDLDQRSAVREYLRNLKINRMLASADATEEGVLAILRGPSEKEIDEIIDRQEGAGEGGQ